MASSDQRLSCVDYHVAWICAVASLELLPARLMLDEEHPVPPYNTHHDENTYTCGMINGHAVVVATCPQGETGNVNAGRLTASLFKTFPNIRMAVLVGIGGGIPRSVSKNALNNIHLGDVVVGWPGDGKPACVYYDRGRSKVNGEFEIVGTTQDPDWRLTSALSMLVSDHKLRRTTFHNQLARLRDFDEFAHPGLDHDRLFNAAYRHIGDYGSGCTECDPKELIQRPPRTEDDKNKLIFHQGRIATGNAVIQDGTRRDQISARCDGALCVEMEAAGVNINRRCLVIRGISDYADSHKDDVWKSYAAGNAAAFTRELLCRVQPSIVKEMQGISEAPWLVAFTRPYSFVGRDNELAHLHAHISSEGGQWLAIYGLGGCGKTALALESAYRTREQQPTRAIFWVPAISQESFEQAYQEIGMLLRIPGIANDKADIKHLVNAKLSDDTFQWLMVVDNADDTSVLFNPLKEGSAHRLIDYLPHSRKGSIIFTTRTRKAAVRLAESNAIALGGLARTEANQLLKKRLFPEHQSQLNNNKIVDEFLDMLVLLALAIVQAVAFINANGVTLLEYISTYKSSEGDAIKLLSEEFEDWGRYRETKNPIATTWYISFKQIQKESELAVKHLSFMACTANTNIPASMLIMNDSKVDQAKAIGTLTAYAFIDDRLALGDGQEAEGENSVRTFDVHPLVHLAMRGWMKTHNQWGVWVEKVVERLVEIIPFGDNNTRMAWTKYLSHAMHVAEVPEVYDKESRIFLLDRISNCERTLGRYRAAELTQRKVYEWKVRMLGKEHPFTLTSLNNVAWALTSQGKYIEAGTMHRETLTLQEKVLSRDHPETLVSMGNLASALTSQGKYIEAETMYRETISLQEKVLSKEHPHTLNSMNSLAEILGNQGKYVEAEMMYRETLALQEKVLSKEHPETLTSMSNLASALTSQGKYIEAETMYRETISLQEKVLSKEHPHTLTSMNSLAAILGNKGNYAEAEMMHRETLALQEKVLSKEHPHTLTSMSNLAWILGRQEKYIEAETMYQETLALQEKVLSKEHPHTLISMSNLARTLGNQGKYAEAETMNRETLALQEKVLSKEHPHSLISMDNLAGILGNQGKYAEAETMHRETLALQEKVLSKEHPDTLISMGSLAWALSGQGKYTEAETMYRETLALQEKVLNKEHLNTLSSVYWLAYLLHLQYQYKEALPLYERACAGLQVALGMDHPTTVACSHGLTSVRQLVDEQAAVHDDSDIAELASRMEKLEIGE